MNEHPYREEISYLEFCLQRTIANQTDAPIAIDPEIEELITRLAVGAIDKFHGTTDDENKEEVLVEDMDCFLDKS